VILHRAARPAAAAAVDTTAIVRSQGAADTSTVIDRKTVIRQDDAGNVDRHSTVIRQTPGETTTIEHHSTTPAPTN
jgi:hypothetical protein